MVEVPEVKECLQWWWPGGWGPQGMTTTGGGGKGPETPFGLWGGTRRERRMHPAVVPSSRRGNTSSESRRRENRCCPKRVSGRHTGKTGDHLSLPKKVRGRARVTGKAGENQVRSPRIGSSVEDTCSSGRPDL